MALNAYLQQTQLLLNDPNATQYNTADLTSWINTARGQIAASQQCIRYNSLITLAVGTQAYRINALSVPAGVQGAITVRQGALKNFFGPGYTRLPMRPYEWFWNYYLTGAVPPPGPPTVWAVQEPGVLGTFMVSPAPDQAYQLLFDVTGYPIPLVDDTTTEVLPYTWTDAVPYFAAYLAYLSTQREQDAQQMLQRWIQFSSWGTKQATPTVLPQYLPGGIGDAIAASKAGVTGFGAPQSQGRGGP